MTWLIWRVSLRSFFSSVSVVVVVVGCRVALSTNQQRAQLNERSCGGHCFVRTAHGRRAGDGRTSTNERTNERTHSCTLALHIDNNAIHIFTNTTTCLIVAKTLHRQPALKHDRDRIYSPNYGFDSLMVSLF